MPLNLLGLNESHPAHTPHTYADDAHTTGVARKSSPDEYADRRVPVLAPKQPSKPKHPGYNRTQIRDGLTVFTWQCVPLDNCDVVDYFLGGKAIGFEAGDGKDSSSSVTGWFEPMCEDAHPRPDSPLTWDFAIGVAEGFDASKLCKQLIELHHEFESHVFGRLSCRQWTAEEVKLFCKDGHTQIRELVVGPSNESYPQLFHAYEQVGFRPGMFAGHLPPPTASSFWMRGRRSRLAAPICTTVGADPRTMAVRWPGKPLLKLRVPYEVDCPRGTTPLSYFLESCEQIRFELPKWLINGASLAGWVVPRVERQHPHPEIDLSWHYSFHFDKEFRDANTADAYDFLRAAFDAAIYLNTTCVNEGKNYYGLPSDFIHAFQKRSTGRTVT